MAKVTSKLQITIPKRLAEQYEIAPGDEIEFIAAGDGIRLVPGRARAHKTLSVAERLRLFDGATDRQRDREKAMPRSGGESPAERDWQREDLYTRGKPR